MLLQIQLATSLSSVFNTQLIVLAKAILALHIALLNVLLKMLGANLQLPAFQFSLAEAALFLLSQ